MFETYTINLDIEQYETKIQVDNYNYEMIKEKVYYMT